MNCIVSTGRLVCSDILFDIFARKYCICQKVNYIFLLFQESLISSAVDLRTPIAGLLPPPLASAVAALWRMATPVAAAPGAVAALEPALN
jgi:hypothetical protein